jgi:hypothetical protein
MDFSISGSFDVVCPEIEYPRIKIHGENECTICGGYYKYQKPKWHFTGTTPKGLWEVWIKTAHPKCQSLKNKLERLKTEVLDCEFELFCKKFNS